MLNFWRRKGLTQLIPPRILVVEDSRTQAATIASGIQSAGFGAEICGSGESALARLGTPGIDVVVTDIVMPGIGGFELCRRIKQQSDPPPVLLLTTLQDPLDVVRGIRVGADYFLTKPLDLTNLLACLREIARRRDAKAGGPTPPHGELTFLGERLQLSADKEQIFALLLAAFEQYVGVRQSEEKRLRELAAKIDAVGKAAMKSADAERASADGLRAGLQRVHDEIVMETRPVMGRLAMVAGWLETDATADPERIAGYADTIKRAIDVSAAMLEEILQRVAQLAEDAKPIAVPIVPRPKRPAVGPVPSGEKEFRQAIALSR